MKNIKTFEFYNDDKPTLMEQFLDWLSSKLGIKIGEYIGGGVEGQIYSIDKNRVIKLTYGDVSSEQYLSSKNIDGIVKIYQTGVIEAPKRFKYPTEDTSWENYRGIHLLNPERTDGKRDTKIGYIIMERLYPSKELEKDLKYLDDTIWFEFKKGDFQTVKDENGKNRQDYVLADNNYHKDTIDVIKDSVLNGFGRFTLSSLFRNIKVDNFVNDLRKFISETQDKKYLKIYDRLVTIAKNIDKLNLDWSDVHPAQFAYNSKKEITALDVSFGLEKWGTDEEGKRHMIKNPTKEEARKKKVKNVIRENKIQKFFEYSETQTISKGDATRKKLGGRSQVIDMVEVEDVLEKYASWYDPKCKAPLYRGIKKYGEKRQDDFLIVEPSKFERVSVDTDNFYNLIIDNDKRWSDFPKRANSIIGTTDESRAFNYGTVYRVIPLFKNSRIAIAPSSDIWWSFSKSFRSDNPMYTTCDDCEGTGDIEHPSGGEVTCGKCEGHGTVEVADLNAFNLKIRKDFRLDKESYTWKEFKSKVGDALPKVTQIFDPKFNGFKLKDYNNELYISDDREFWTDAKCLLIREDLFLK
jgi:hypothetical protein